MARPIGGTPSYILREYFPRKCSLFLYLAFTPYTLRYTLYTIHYTPYIIKITQKITLFLLNPKYFTTFVVKMKKSTT